MAWLTIRGLKVLRTRIEAFWNVLIMSGTPLSLIVMQKTHHDMNLMTRLNLQLLLGSFGKNDILGDSMRS